MNIMTLGLLLQGGSTVITTFFWLIIFTIRISSNCTLELSKGLPDCSVETFLHVLYIQILICCNILSVFVCLCMHSRQIVDAQSLLLDQFTSHDCDTTVGLDGSRAAAECQQLDHWTGCHRTLAKRNSRQFHEDEALLHVSSGET